MSKKELQEKLEFYKKALHAAGTLSQAAFLVGNCNTYVLGDAISELRKARQKYDGIISEGMENR